MSPIPGATCSSPWSSSSSSYSGPRDSSASAVPTRFEMKLKLIKILSPLLLVVAFPLFPAINDYWIDVGFLVGIYVMLGLSLNIVLGEVGLFDLGHTAFYAIG